ncbi:MAG: hypothetical protein KDC71_20335 [Acidobacteria bacterium]|nr:hypothetical protein [Acidobacteriota bacterium]MCB9236251.1 hypothetical protein [Bacteroidia bacterium]
MAKITISGCHGTSNKCAAKILAEGFELSPQGKLGAGIYIWEKQEGWRELATDWHAQKVAAGRYDGDISIAIIFCDLTVAGQNFLDMLDTAVKGMVDAFVSSEITVPSDRMYDWIVERLEKLLGNKILLVRSYVSIPAPRIRNYKGNKPISLLAKCKSIVTITSVEGLKS